MTIVYEISYNIHMKMTKTKNAKVPYSSRLALLITSVRGTSFSVRITDTSFGTLMIHTK